MYTHAHPRTRTSPHYRRLAASPFRCPSKFPLSCRPINSTGAQRNIQFIGPDPHTPRWKAGHPSSCQKRTKGKILSTWLDHSSDFLFYTLFSHTCCRASSKKNPNLLLLAHLPKPSPNFGRDPRIATYIAPFPLRNLTWLALSADHLLVPSSSPISTRLVALAALLQLPALTPSSFDPGPVSLIYTTQDHSQIKTKYDRLIAPTCKPYWGILASLSTFLSTASTKSHSAQLGNLQDCKTAPALIIHTALRRFYTISFLILCYSFVASRHFPHKTR